MLRRVLNFELSSDLSDTYASGLEVVVVVVVVSAVDAVEVVGDGAGDALALLEEDSPDDGELILDSVTSKEFSSAARVGGRASVFTTGFRKLYTSLATGVR